MAKKLEKTEAVSSRAMKNLSEKRQIIQKQAQLIKEKKSRVALKEEMLRISRKSELMQR